MIRVLTVLESSRTKQSIHMIKMNKQQIVKNKSCVSSQVCHEVDFVFECEGAEHVYVCGDFNGWQPTSLRMIGDAEAGLWETRLSLPCGRFEYKFIVDGKWMPDPHARENVPNGYASLNSVVEIAS